MKKMIIPAMVEELEEINSFIDGELEAYGCAPKVRMQIELAVEEIFVNIASYAYHPEVGQAEICVGVDARDGPPTVRIQFLDSGRPFNPLEKPDADTTLAAEERGIGGLGILLAKKNMDDISYSYENEKNILTIRKKLSG